MIFIFVLSNSNFATICIVIMDSQTFQKGKYPLHCTCVEVDEIEIASTYLRITPLCLLSHVKAVKVGVGVEKAYQ